MNESPVVSSVDWRQCQWWWGGGNDDGDISPSLCLVPSLKPPRLASLCLPGQAGLVLVVPLRG